VGVDDVIVEALNVGAVGWVAGLVNAYPAESVKLFELAKAGKHEEAFELYRWFLPLLRLDTVPKVCAADQVGAGRGRRRLTPASAHPASNSREQISPKQRPCSRRPRPRALRFTSALSPSSQALSAQSSRARAATCAGLSTFVVEGMMNRFVGRTYQLGCLAVSSVARRFQLRASLRSDGYWDLRAPNPSGDGTILDTFFQTPAERQRYHRQSNSLAPHYPYRRNAHHGSDPLRDPAASQPLQVGNANRSSLDGTFATAS
jgi:hypothetical protein